MFNWFKESTDDKYLRALSEAEGEWKISKELHMTSVELHTENETFSFVKEDYFITKNFYEKIIHEFIRIFSKICYPDQNQRMNKFLAFSL